ncbi:hypothetical protein STSP2_01537 [Anaerohalosphaera lusitana]|uniref:Uncharacterized protein n=1 Tax=Anaerohalosphaera lusitana TaxID=1936003 RepID=A0A1U9NKQ2_9BACT|nr:hypothetical protein [Anaerohalosphaera lusitana]AQT68377.1 hypothetical protein STSP2_01537 [Anaerohalosphaera lusitana]
MASMCTTFEQIAGSVNDLDKNGLVNKIMNFDGAFPMDFTEGYLKTLNEDQLRHILASAILTKLKHQA